MKNSQKKKAILLVTLVISLVLLLALLIVALSQCNGDQEELLRDETDETEGKKESETMQLEDETKEEISSSYNNSETDDETHRVLEESDTERVHQHIWSEWNEDKVATCTKQGSEKRICTCGETETRTTPALEHSEVIDVSVDPTCTETGLTEGSHCSRCSIVFVEQESIPAVGHVESLWIWDKRPTLEEEGTKHTECLKCGMTVKTEILNKLILSEGLAFVSNNDGTCYVAGRGSCGDEEIVIPSISPDGDVVKSICKNAFHDDRYLTSVILPESVVRIDEYAFLSCEKLKNVVLAEGLTWIGAEAFSSCSNLESIVIPSSLNCFSRGVFIGCRNLTEVYIADLLSWLKIEMKQDAWNFHHSYNLYLDGELLTDIVIPVEMETLGRNLRYCGSLKHVVIPEGIINIDGAFIGCNNLESIVIPDTVTAIGGQTFADCHSLKEVTLPDSITMIGAGAFDNCWELEEEGEITYVGKWVVDCSLDAEHIVLRPDTVGIIESLFEYSPRFPEHANKKLKSVFIPGTVKYICGRAFEGARNLKEVEFGEQSQLTSIGFNAFAYCYNLQNINIPDSVTSIENGAFDGCSSLANIKIPDGVTSIGNSAFRGCRELTSIVIPTGVTTIGGYAFENCTNLSSVEIPDTVTSIGGSAFDNCDKLIQKENGLYYVDRWVVDYEGHAKDILCREDTVGIAGNAFSLCTSLKSVVIPNGVKTIGESAFGQCSNLISIQIPDSVKSIEPNAFSGCSSLTNIEIPCSVMSIGSGAFSGCSNLTSIEIPYSVTSIGLYAFKSCKSLRSICVDDDNPAYYSEGNCIIETATQTLIVGCNASIIPSEITRISEGAFYECTALKNIKIPDGVTSIGEYAFWTCRQLESIELPDSVMSIGKNAFWKCGQLTSIVIPDGVANIDNYTFYECEKLAKIVIPVSVKNIGVDAFFYCGNLCDIYYTGTEDEWATITIGASNEPLLNATIHYNYTPDP